MTPSKARATLIRAINSGLLTKAASPAGEEIYKATQAGIEFIQIYEEALRLVGLDDTTGKAPEEWRHFRMLEETGHKGRSRRALRDRVGAPGPEALRIIRKGEELGLIESTHDKKLTRTEKGRTYHGIYREVARRVGL